MKYDMNAKYVAKKDVAAAGMLFSANPLLFMFLFMMEFSWPM